MLQKMVIARTPSTGNHHQSQIFLSARSRALADGAHTIAPEQAERAVNKLSMTKIS